MGVGLQGYFCCFYTWNVFYFDFKVFNCSLYVFTLFKMDFSRKSDTCLSTLRVIIFMKLSMYTRVVQKIRLQSPCESRREFFFDAVAPGT